MKEIRKQIDTIDKNIIKLLGKRLKLAVKISKFKEKKGLPILDKKREAEMIEEFEKIAKKERVDPKFIKKLWEDIFKESRKIQKGNYGS